MSPHADGTRATVPNPIPPIDHRAVYTEPHTQCDQQSAIDVDCRPYLKFTLAVFAGAVNTRPTDVAVYIALVDGRRAVAKFLRVTAYML